MESRSSPPKEAHASPGPEVPAGAGLSSKNPSVSWASSVFEKGLTRKLGPELEKPAHIRTGLRFISLAN